MKLNRWLTPLAIGAGLGVVGYLSDGDSYGGGYQETQSILSGEVQYPWFFAPLTAAASFLTLSSGIPGGLFDPSLTVGAGLGQSMLPLINWVSPGLEPEAVIMMFMVAYFAGVVQSPITCAIIMVEMTAARHMTLPLLGVAVTPMSARVWSVALRCTNLWRTGFLPGSTLNPRRTRRLKKPLGAQLGDDGFGNQFIVLQPINRDASISVTLNGLEFQRSPAVIDSNALQFSCRRRMR